MGEAYPLNLLLDTCTLIWLDSKSSRLSALARQVLADSANRIYLSSVSAWEITHKFETGKLNLWGSSTEFLKSLHDDFGLEPLPFTQEDAQARSGLKLLHKDPFDLMLICQAQNRGLTLVTPDPAIRQYPIPVLW